jgi:hypothetical protein
MINLIVDEAYAFDYLSILEIKKNLNISNAENWRNCFISIQNQIGIDLMNLIINSQEYKKMIQANQITFDAVEKARYGSITAKEVDEANMLRHKRKIELQAKFFKKSLLEQKT